MKTKPMVGIVMGSTSDWEVMQQAAKQLTHFGVAFEAKALSAHRTPAELEAWVGKLERGGAKCFIAGAGGAAHLAGVIAAKTVLPVLGVVMVIGETIGLVVSDARLMARHRHAAALRQKQASSDL